MNSARIKYTLTIAAIALLFFKLIYESLTGLDYLLILLVSALAIYGQQPAHQPHAQTSIFTANLFGVVVVDECDRLVDANDTFLQLLGYSREELQQLTWHAITAPASLRQNAASESVYPDETEMLRRDGSRAAVLVGTADNQHHKQKIRFVIDLSERKWIETELQQAVSSSRQYANQLRGLAQAALAINLSISLEERLQAIVAQARQIIGADQALISVSLDDDWAQPIGAIALSDQYRGYTPLAQSLAPICLTSLSVRMTSAQTAAEFGESNPLGQNLPPLKGWLAASLVGHDGQHFGSIHLSDKAGEDFTASDEAILLQLAQTASAAIENAILYQAAHAAQVQLRSQLEFTSAIAHSLGEGVYAIDLEGKITFVNPAAQQMLGWLEAELLTQDSHTLFHYQHPDGTPSHAAESQILAVLRSGVAHHNDDDVFLRKDGTMLAIAYTAAPIFSNDQVTGAVVAFRDITERKQAAKAFAEINIALESAVESIARLDRQGRYLTVNPTYAAMHGYAPENLIGNTWHATVHPQDLAKVETAHQQMIATGKAEIEVRGIRKNGSTFYKQIVLVKADNEQNNFVGFYCFVKDITQRQRVEERLRLLESVVVNANDAIVITEAESVQLPGPRILYVNEAFTRITGYSPHEVIGKTPRLLQGAKTDRDTLNRIRTTLQQWQPSVFELINYRKDGTEFWVEMSIVPVADETGYYTHWVSVQRDITERKRTEKVLAQLLLREQQARIATEEASRLKDEFLAVVSHELRTPLNAMLGWSRLLRSRSFNEQTTARALETIERNAQAQAQLIEDILDISRMMRGKLRLHCCPVNLVHLIEVAIDTIRPAAEAKNIQIETVLPPTVSPISGDRDRLQQVIWNLLSNAVKFTPTAGRVEISLLPETTYIELRVSDNGQGISAEFLPYIFEQFRQADSSSSRKQGGLGLGLAIVRSLVELHGGAIAATSPGIGQGSTFTVRLPLKAGLRSCDLPIDSATRDDELPPKSELVGLQILVVDDEADARELVKVVLEQVGASVTTVASVQEALDIIEQLQPDVLLSDIGMPGEDGYSLIQKVNGLKNSGRYIPAAAITAYARAEDQTQALQAGFQTHLAKPVDPNELIAVVATLAGRNV